MTSPTGRAASSSRRFLAATLATACLATSGCQTNSVERQTAALTLPAENLAQRQAQTRRFETTDERFIMGACAAVLQDLGFLLEESSVGAGLVVASKNRDAVEVGQVAGQILLVALAAAMGVRADPVWERDQKIRVSISTKLGSDGSTVVRTTFQRIIWNTKSQISRIETIDDPTVYQGFFDKLSQAVFLEAHQI